MVTRKGTLSWQNAFLKLKTFKSGEGRYPNENENYLEKSRMYFPQLLRKLSSIPQEQKIIKEALKSRKRGFLYRKRQNGAENVFER